MIKKILDNYGIDSDKQQSKYIQMLPNCYSLPMGLVHGLYAMMALGSLGSFGVNDPHLLITSIIMLLCFGSLIKFSNKILQLFKPWILLSGYVLGLVIPLMHAEYSTALILQHVIMIFKSVLVVGGAAQIVVLIIDIFFPLETKTNRRVKATFNEFYFIGIIIFGLAIVCWFSSSSIDTALFADILKIFVGWCLTLLITILFKMGKED